MILRHFLRLSVDQEEVQGSWGDDLPVCGGSSSWDVHPGLHTQAHRSDHPGRYCWEHLHQTHCVRQSGETGCPSIPLSPATVWFLPGKLAFFKAMVKGQPAPTVTWTRNKGDLTDTEKYICRYDDRNKEYFLEVSNLCSIVNETNNKNLSYCQNPPCFHVSSLSSQMPNVTAEQADTYKCFATNEYGQAVSTATLNIIEGERSRLLKIMRILVYRRVLPRCGWVSGRNVAVANSHHINHPQPTKCVLLFQLVSRKTSKKVGEQIEKLSRQNGGFICLSPYVHLNLC